MQRSPDRPTDRQSGPSEPLVNIFEVDWGPEKLTFQHASRRVVCWQRLRRRDWRNGCRQPTNSRINAVCMDVGRRYSNKSSTCNQEPVTIRILGIYFNRFRSGINYCSCERVASRTITFQHRTSLECKEKWPCHCDATDCTIKIRRTLLEWPIDNGFYKVPLI